MARQRKNIVRLDGDFVAKVERLASGGVAGVGARYRTRRTTLEDVAKDIVAEAKRLTDLPARQGSARDRGGLPGRQGGYPFRKDKTVSDRGYGTYRSSFKANVTKKNGRLLVVAFNKQDWAGDVEFGTRRFGSRIFAKKQYLALPITKNKYSEIQKSRNLKIAERRAKGWPSADKKQRALYSRRAYFKKTKAAELAERGIEIKSSRRRATGTFVSRGADGKHWMFTRSVRTRDGYKILRRAMRRVASRKFG